jgi:hypothetical protein
MHPISLQPAERLRAWCQPGSLPLLAALLVFAAAFAFCWTALPGRCNMIEHEGYDFVNHTILIHRQAHPVPASLQGYHGKYPQLSHAVAACFMPVLGDNAIRAMDCATWLVVLGLFAVQWTLLCRLLPAALALAGLVGWQYLRMQTLFGDWNFFTRNCYFPQAMGTLAVWLQVVVLASTTTPARPRRWLREGVALLLAAFAYGCHIVPGAAAFATLAVVQCSRLLGPDRKGACLRLLLTVLAGAALALGTDQLAVMAGARRDSAALPTVHLWLLLLWVPTLLAAWAGLVRGRWPGRPLRTDDQEVVLACALLAVGGLQGYLALEKVLGLSGSFYSANKFFWLTFAYASLLWVCWLSRGVRSLKLPLPPKRLQTILRPAVAVGGVLLALFALRELLRDDLRRADLKDISRPAAWEWGRCLLETPDPLALIRELTLRRGKLASGTYYHDPANPFTALFASVIGLEMNHDVGLRCWSDLSRKGDAIRPIAARGEIGHVLLPRNANPCALFGTGVPAKPAGAFLDCDLGRVGKGPSAGRNGTLGLLASCPLPLQFPQGRTDNYPHELDSPHGAGIE